MICQALKINLTDQTSSSWVNSTQIAVIEVLSSYYPEIIKGTFKACLGVI